MERTLDVQPLRRVAAYPPLRLRLRRGRSSACDPSRPPSNWPRVRARARAGVRVRVRVRARDRATTRATARLALSATPESYP